MSFDQYKVAVLVPCYNEAVAIAEVVTGFREALSTATIFVFDNNSTDNTVQAARDARDKACAADSKKLCLGQEGREAAMCLRENVDKTSQACQAASAKVRSLMGAMMGGFGPH